MRQERVSMKKIVDIEQKLYAKMCSNCPSAKKCHEQCENCEEYENELKKALGHKRANQLTHQEKMSIYNLVNEGKLYKHEIANKYNITLYTLRQVYKDTHDLIRYKVYGEPPKYPKVCNVCGGKVKFNRCDKSKSKSGFVYYCTKCYAWVGTSPREPKVALGELANKDIRRMRVELHKWFDKLWKNRNERKECYDRLAKELGKQECHFSQMDMSELEKSLSLVKKWWFEKFDK